VEDRARRAVEGSREVRQQLEGAGMSWGLLRNFIKDQAVPANMDDGLQVAYSMVPKVLTALYGLQNQSWYAFKHDGKTWVKQGRKP